ELDAVRSLQRAGSQPHVLGLLSWCGILCRRALFLLRDIGLAARRAAGSDVVADARHRMGLRAFVCRHRGGELDVRLHHSRRVLDGDYGLFDGGCVDVSEAGCPVVSASWPDARRASAREPDAQAALASANAGATVSTSPHPRDAAFAKAAASSRPPAAP